MDLAEFLLARIAEDEDAAVRSCGQVHPGADVYCGPDGHPDVFRLAECDAKRGLIRDAADVPTISMRRALRWLALPYANHPDYHVEWRPGPVA